MRNTVFLLTLINLSKMSQQQQREQFLRLLLSIKASGGAIDGKGVIAILEFCLKHGIVAEISWLANVVKRIPYHYSPCAPVVQSDLLNAIIQKNDDYLKKFSQEHIKQEMLMYQHYLLKIMIWNEAIVEEQYLKEQLLAHQNEDFPVHSQEEIDQLNVAIDERKLAERHAKVSTTYFEWYTEMRLQSLNGKATAADGTDW